MKRDFEAVKRIVIKIGTSSLVLPNGKINLAKIDQLAFVISSLVGKGKEIVLVSSGAMGFGLNVLNMEKRPVEMAQQQAVSSVGQVAMMSLYSQIFSHYRMTVSQILLTRDVVEYPESLANVPMLLNPCFPSALSPLSMRTMRSAWTRWIMRPSLATTTVCQQLWRKSLKPIC